MASDDLDAAYHDLLEELRVLPPSLPHHLYELQRLRDTAREAGGRLNDFAELVDRWVRESVSPT
ncbi:MAG: hypothetical protein ACYCU7_18225 [Acidimicrobiales bacterium]